MSLALRKTIYAIERLKRHGGPRMILAEEENHN